MEKIPISNNEKPEKLIESNPKLRHINKTLELLRPEMDEFGNEINWKELYKEIKPWQNGMELSDNVREVVYEYISLKVPALKESIPTIQELKDKDVIDALVHNWPDEEIEGRRQVLMTVATQIVKRIETVVYKRVLDNVSDADFETKLGVDPKLKDLLIGLLDVTQRADPLFVRFLAFSKLSPEPPDEATPTGIVVPGDDKPHTIADLFPHETSSISKNLSNLAEDSIKWEDLPGADTFKSYLQVVCGIYSAKDPKQAQEYVDQAYKLYDELLRSDFPIILANGMVTSQFYKAPYIDPELKVSISTPDTRQEEIVWRMAQKGMADSLNVIGAAEYAEEMRGRTIRSAVAIGGHGVNLTFAAVADEEPSILVFLNEQIRGYDKDFPEFMGLVKNRDEEFPDQDTQEEKIFMERMSRSNTIHHELAHSISPRGLSGGQRLGKTPLVTIDEVKAETLYRSLIPAMIEGATLAGNKEQWAIAMLTSSMQILKDNSIEDGASEDEYYRAAVYTLNDLFEKGVVKFENDQVEITDFDKFYEINRKISEDILALYRDESMNETKAKKWIRDFCRPNEQVKAVEEFLRNRDSK